MKKIAKWMWYPGDFEIYHTMLVNNRREARGTPIMCMWRVDSPHANVLFYKTAELEHGEKLTVRSNGLVNVTVNNKYQYAKDEEITLPSGHCFVKIHAFKDGGFPCVYCEGDSFSSDETWNTGTHSPIDYHVGVNDMYTDINDNPEVFKFSYKKIYPQTSESIDGGTLYDFGKETFAKLNFENISNNPEDIGVYYGESREEALDTKVCLVCDAIKKNEKAYTMPARAFRYIFVDGDKAEYALSADYEYIPVEISGKFTCDDELINKIRDVAEYTFELNTRECYLDGIKRDRWVWGGDAYESYLINFYLSHDNDCVRRTILGLRGAAPLTQNINTILDYSLLWIMGIYQYYFYTGDVDFLKYAYTKAVETVDFLNSTRRDERGLLCGIKGDWTFIDWAKFDKEGPICAEQMLMCYTLYCMERMSEALGLDGSVYRKDADKLKRTINALYWDKEKGAFINSITSGNREVTRHSNIFALLYNLTSETRKKTIVKKVIKNKDIPPITTPYFEFFELDAMCGLGEFKFFSDMLRSYWGGMLSLGATSFWEHYNPALSKIENYAMYGNPYGKSLCHAWSGSPIYLLGKYVLGVTPTSPGYKTYSVRPCLLDLNYYTGSVPVPGGTVEVSLDKRSVSVNSDIPGGTLFFGNKEYDIIPGETLVVKQHGATE